jgi:hypothetical protein
MQAQNKFEKYENSPLGQLLGGILEAVSVVQKAHPKKGDAAPKNQREHADELLGAVKWALGVVHEEILPRFDNGNDKPGFPGTIAQARYGVNILKYWDLVSTRESLLFSKIDKLLPDLFKTAQKDKSGSPICLIVSDLLEKKRNSLIEESSKKIPGKDVNEFFSAIQKVIVTQKMQYYHYNTIVEPIFGIGAPYEDGSFSFEHFHPMIFDLSVEIALLLLKAPRKFDKLVSFLEPTAPGAFFDAALKTFVPWLVKNLVPDLGLDNTKFEHQKNAEHDGPTYCYQLTLPDEGEADVDLDEGYNDHYAYIFSLFLWQIATHRDKFPKGSPVDKAVNQFLQKARAFYFKPENETLLRSDKAMSHVLQFYVESQVALIKKKFDQTLPRVLSFEGLSGIELIDALDTELMNECSRNYTYGGFIDARNHYYRSAVLNLISGEPLALLEKCKESGLDTSYSNEKIPYTILDFEDQEVRIIPIQSRLVKTINEHIRLLDYDKNRIEILRQKKNEATEALFRQKIADCHQWKQTTFEAVENYHRSINLMVTNSKKRVIDSSDIESLNSAIEQVSSDKKTVEDAKRFTEVSWKEAAEKFCLLEHENAWKDSREYKKQREEISKSVISQLDKALPSALLDDVKSSLALEELRLTKALAEAQEMQRKQALAEAEYENNMDSLKSGELEGCLKKHSDRLCVLAELKFENGKENEGLNVELDKLLRNDSLSLIREAIEIEKEQIERENKDKAGWSQNLQATVGILLKNDMNRSVMHFLDNPECLIEFIKLRTVSIAAQISENLKSKSYSSVINELEILEPVKKIVESNNNPSNPKAKLDNLMKQVMNDGKIGGFQNLLKMLGCSTEESSVWEKYQQRNKQLFDSPNKNEHAIRLKSLRDLLELKINELEKSKKGFSDHELRLNNSAKRLTEIKESLRDNDVLKLIHEKRSEIQRNEKEKSAFEAEEKSIRTQLEALHPRIILLKEIESTSKNIADFCGNASKFSADLDLFSLVVKLYKELNKISQLNQEFKALCEKVEHKEVYQKDSRKVDVLIDSMVHKLNRSVEDKFSPEQGLVTKLKSNIDSFERSKAIFSTDVELYSEACLLKNERAQLRDCIDRLKSETKKDDLNCHFHDILDHIEIASQPLVLLVDEVINKKYDNTVESIEKYLTDFVDRHANLSAEFYSRDPEHDNCLSSRFSVEKIDGILKSVTALDAEVQEKYTEAQAILMHIQILQDQQKSSGLSLVYDRVTSLKNAVSDLKQKSERAELLSKLSGMLSAYLVVLRKKQIEEHYSEDGPKVQYLESLRNIMDVCAIEGNCTSLLNKIKEGKSTFASVHFTTLLNQITVAVLEFDRSVAKHPEIPFADLDVEKRLNTLKINHLKFVNGINILYNNIKKMEQDAAKLPDEATEDRKVISQLAADLRSDVNRYILSIADNENPALKFQPFKEIFTARLHSQDTVIRKHRPLWVILCSIAAALFSLGTVLAYSKYKTGRFMFFFENSAPIRSEIATMEDVVNRPQPFVQV